MKSCRLAPSSVASFQPSRWDQAGLVALITPSSRATSITSVESRHIRSRSAVRSATRRSSVWLSVRSASSTARRSFTSRRMAVTNVREALTQLEADISRKLGAPSFRRATSSTGRVSACWSSRVRQASVQPCWSWNSIAIGSPSSSFSE